MTVIGLDLGTKRIGVAVTDELHLTAQPHSTLERQSLAVDIQFLVDLARERGAQRFVVGLPLNMDGSEGYRAEDARKFAAKLAQASGLPIDFQDERLTTVAAERVLISADLSRAKRKKAVDRVAATLILQAWLEAHPSDTSDQSAQGEDTTS